MLPDIKGCCQLRVDLQLVLVWYALRSREGVAMFKEIAAQGTTEVTWRRWRGVTHKCKCPLWSR